MASNYLQWSWIGCTTKLYQSKFIPVEVGPYYPRVTCMLNPPVEFGERIPPRVTHVSEEVWFQRAICQSRPLKRSFAMLGQLSHKCLLLRFQLTTNTTDVGVPEIMNPPAPTRSRSTTTRRPTDSELLRRLDSQVRPGITYTEFQKLFVECECGLVTTRRSFEKHECIIDISDDE
jgi:hypothetical protein